MKQDKEYNEFHYKWLIAIRKNKNYKYKSIRSLNLFIKRKWIKKKANEEYDKYIITDDKETKIKFNDNIEIREFTSD